MSTRGAWMASVALVGVAALLAPADAAASELGNERYNAPPAIAERHWYGWQTLIADVVFYGAGTATYAVAAADDASTTTKNTISLATLGAYVVASPLIHGLHGHAGKAFGSLGLRLGGAIVGGFAGAGVGALATKSDDDGIQTGAALGALGGMIVVSIIDAAAIANEEVYRPELRPYGPRTERRLALAPSAVLTPGGGAVLGLGGSF